jgi:beta-lactamase regulating signal transducer with metallopeptidase domain
MIAAVGLIKLLIPPFLVSDRINETLTSGTVWISSITNYSNAEITRVPQISFSGFLFILWLTIAIIFLLIVLVRHWALYYEFKGLKCLETPRTAFSDELHNIKLYQSEKIHSPFVIGFFKHKIVVPANWQKWDNQTQCSILTHELAHIKAGDHWINLIKLIVLSAHFYNPLTWILVRKLTHYSEIVCDEISIQNNRFERKSYANMLLNIAEATGGRLIGASTLNFSKTHQLIKNRITYQLKQKEYFMIKKSKLLSKFIIPGLLLLIIPLSWQYNDLLAQEKSKIAETSDIMEYDEVTKKPEIVTKVGPKYPDEARKAGIEGVVMVTAIIGKDGKVIETAIFKSVTDNEENKKLTKEKFKIAQLLDLAAIDAVKLIEFSPAEYEGKPVKVKMNIPIHFALK